jgi:hypothetical protein
MAQQINARRTAEQETRRECALTDGVAELEVDGLGPLLVDVGLGRRRHAPGVEVAHLVHGARAAVHQEQQHRRGGDQSCPRLHHILLLFPPSAPSSLS